MERTRNCKGRINVETLIEMLILISIVPPLVCCALQAVVAIVAIAIPWIVLALLTIGMAACLVAAISSRRGAPRNVESSSGTGAPMLPPVRRPAGIRGPDAPRGDH